MSTASAAIIKPRWIFCGVFLLCALLIKPVQDGLQARTGGSVQEPDLLYFSSPGVVKKMALGYDQLLADVYWMRVIQYYGRRDEADKRLIRFKNLSTLLDITTTLDPGLMDAYRAGATFLGEPEPVGAGQPKEALKLLDKGIKAHPKEWVFWYDKGFVHYLYLNDYKTAGEIWQAGSRIEGAPEWMGSLAAMSFSKGGALELGIALWQKQYRESTRADVRENARNHLISIEVARNLWTLEALIEKYQAERNAMPATLRELVRGKEDRYPIVDPLGTPYDYNPVTGAVSLNTTTKVTYLNVPYSYRESLDSGSDLDK